MDSSVTGQLGSMLRDRRDDIADRWCQAIGRTGFVRLSALEVRQRLAALLDEAVPLLLTDTPDRPSSRRIGAILADLSYAHPEALSGTQELLAHELTAGLSGEQEREMWPRLTLLLSEMAAGFLECARDTVLAEQESILSALLAAREETQEALRESEARFRAIFDAAAIGIGIGDVNGRIMQTNRAIQEMFGYTAEEMQQRVVAQFMHPDDVASVWRLYEELVAGKRNYFQTEKRYFRKNGQTIWCHLTVSLVRDAAGLPQLQIAMIRNITERKQAEEALRRNEERFRALVQNSTDAIVVVGVGSTVLYQSPATARILGAPLNNPIDAATLARLHPDDIPRIRSFAADLTETPGSGKRTEFRFQHHDGTWRWLEAIVTNLLSDPSVGGMVANVRDITDRKRFEEQLQYEALHDSLTGLPNRALFNDRLARALAHSTPPDEEVTVLLVDLDHFKIINDSLGHEAGDQALITVARRLRECLYASDTVARLGGDEFAILLEGLTQREATRIAERILASLREPVRVLGRDAVVSASVGVARCHPGLDLPSDLLRAADIALYRAKAAGRSTIAVFETSMQAHAVARLELEANLMPALERGQFELYFQPEVELASGRISFFEALVRWNRPGHGLVPPSDFVPLAEETGLILPLGQWVLTQACRVAREWTTGQPGRPPVGVSVNLSAQQLRQPDLVDQVTRALSETGLDTHLLRLEVTERALVEDLAATDEALRDLRRRGVRVAIDDFGTGYSSLLYLRRLAVDSIKIDQSFVRGLGTFDQDRAIVQAITALVHTLDMDVTAEGIETAAQLEAAMEVGCDRGQGYYFARPAPADAVEDLLGRSSLFDSVRVNPNGVADMPRASFPH